MKSFPCEKCGQLTECSAIAPVGRLLRFGRTSAYNCIELHGNTGSVRVILEMTLPEFSLAAVRLGVLYEGVAGVAKDACNFFSIRTLLNHDIGRMSSIILKSQ